MTEEQIDAEKLARKTQMLRDTNAGLAREIEQMGAGVDGLHLARLEHFFRHLIEIGVVTEEQFVKESYEWEKGLRTQLVSIRDQAKHAVEQQRAALREHQRRIEAAQAKQLAEQEQKDKPDAPKLILPPGAKK